MKVSYKWLKELMPHLKAGPDQIAARLTQIGLEVESLENLGDKLHQVVVAQVVEVEKHPQADRLTLCQVFDGSQEHPVVCGAPNVRPGKKYPLALVGARMPQNLIINKTTIRGVESHGMLCSARELGLSSESTGLLELDDEAKVGLPFGTYYGLDDTVLEINITPNRGDCLSHWGICREVAAAFSIPFKVPRIPTVRGLFPLKEHLKIRVRNSKKCPRYCSRVIRGVKIGKSPRWMSQRLESLGIRSVNHVVDATNYVMLEMGHPLHAFDHRFIRGARLEVRMLGVSCPFTTLDQEVNQLVPSDLVIADGEGAVALAGIMGGMNSEIREDTQILVLEAACFEPTQIRQTAKRLGIQTESSIRFERTVPADSVLAALNRLTQLILDVSGGEASLDVFDHHPRKERRRKISLRESTILGVVGGHLSSKLVGSLLKALNLSPTRKKGGWQVLLPEYRSDLSREIDLVEEVVRLIGFEGMKSQIPCRPLKPVSQDPAPAHREEVVNFFAARGFHEILSFSFCGMEEIQKMQLGLSDAISIKNPLSQDMAYMRPSLLGGLLGAYLKNRSASPGGLRFFELRSIYLPPRRELKRIAALYQGNFFETNWQHIEREMNFFDGKGILEDLYDLFRIDVIFELDKKNLYHPQQTVAIKSRGGVSMGHFGRLHPELLGRFGIGETLYYMDLDYSELIAQSNPNTRYRPLSVYPLVERDVALIASNDLTYNRIVETIQSYSSPWLKKVSLFDLYEGDKVPKGCRSLALSLVYENAERTLTDEEVNSAHFALVDYLKEKLGVELRQD